jgi:IS1 family transposase
MANKLSHANRKLILRLLCEGNSIRSTSRITGRKRDTIGRVILGFGNACAIMMDEVFRDLTLEHVEVDEVWSFVGKKQARLTVDQKRERHDIGDIYLWTCVDQKTKLIPSHLVGKRSADNARRLMVDLASRLILPGAGTADDHAFVKGEFRPVVQISTDGLAAYPEAIDLAFGPFATHGVLIKKYRNATMPYDPSEMVGTKREVKRGEISQWSICTSHVERTNGTIRTFMKRLSRLTYAFSKKLENHQAAIAMFIAYYNFVWRTRYPDNSGRPGTLRPPAAMMAGVVSHLWNFDNFYSEAIMYG